LNPLKPKLLINQTAEQTGLPLNVISAVVNAYYEELHRVMSTCQDINVNVAGLGIFTIKKNSLDRKITSTKAILDKFLPRIDGSQRAKYIYDDKTEMMNNLLRASKRMQQEIEQKQDTLIRKQEYYKQHGKTQ
jgi:nucleoid DNA-binding protein